MSTFEPANYYYSGQGVVLIGDRDSNGRPVGLIPVGNVSDLRVTVQTQVLEHKESMTGARGIDLRLTQEVRCNLQMTMENFNAENLALVTRGAQTTLAAAVGASHDVGVAKLGKVLALPHIKVSNVVVKDVTDVTTYTLGTDYLLNADAGSIMPLSTGTISEDDVLHIDYDYAAQERVDSLTEASLEKYMRFEGLNTALSNEPVIVEVFKCLVDPLQELLLIGDNIGQFTLQGNALADTLQQTGSKYWKQMLLR